MGHLVFVMSFRRCLPVLAGVVEFAGWFSEKAADLCGLYGGSPARRAVLSSQSGVDDLCAETSVEFEAGNIFTFFMRKAQCATAHSTPQQGLSCSKRASPYPFRAGGLCRIMRGDEARKQCPDLQLVQVPTAHGKSDLTLYRQSGSKVTPCRTV
jgi:hypothetical protein